MNTQLPTPPRRGWLTANVVSQLAFGLLAMTICLPSMQEWPATFGASQARVQLTLSAFVVAYGVLQLLYGPLSDRAGRKPVLMGGLTLACLGSLAAVFAPNLEVLTLARMLQGAGAAAGMVVGRALVQDLFVGPERTRMMAFVGMTMGVCPPLATLIGGQLHVRLGWQSNFVLVAALSAALLMAAWRGLPVARPDVRRHALGWREFIAGYVRLGREPAFLLFVLILSTTTAAFYTFLGGAPIVLAGYGVTPERIGWYIMWVPAAYIVGNLLTSRLIRPWGDRFVMGLGQACTLGGPVLLVVLGLAGLHTPLGLALPLVFLGIGHGLLVPPTLAGTVGRVPALAGSAAAVGGLMQQLSGAIGAFVVGLLTHEGPVNLALMMLVWAACGLGAQVALHRFVLYRSD